MKQIIVLSAGVLLVFGGMQTSVHATEYTSNGSITFTADTGITLPVNPTNPQETVEPVNPTNPEGTVTPGTTGSLSIDFASSFQFGTQVITSESKTYYAAVQEFSDGTTGPNYVQVSDKRGTQTGWQLSVIQEEQFQTENGEKLEGAALSINFADVKSITSMDYAPDAEASVKFVPGTETPLVNAPEGKGMGTWVYRFGSDETEAATAVQLEVPGASVKLAKEYRTTLTWNLKAVPEN